MTFQTDLLPLSSLQKGQMALIEEINGDNAEVEKLCAMGFRVGAMVKKLCAGRCCAVQVEETRVVLRCDQLSQILVSPLL
jgi:Fe2+ transport system protein FeoA